MSMCTLLRTMDLPGKSAATKRPKSFPLMSPVWDSMAGTRFRSRKQKKTITVLVELAFG